MWIIDSPQIYADLYKNNYAYYFIKNATFAPNLCNITCAFLNSVF